ncbi:hypothetical protein EDB19DRAFT_1833572 [Suillus lakei]|nr:hypothetical protein EDB19DRAFT_1833572 [Suillus lakei]
MSPYNASVDYREPVLILGITCPEDKCDLGDICKELAIGGAHIPHVRFTLLGYPCRNYLTRTRPGNTIPSGEVVVRSHVVTLWMAVATFRAEHSIVIAGGSSSRPRKQGAIAYLDIWAPPVFVSVLTLEVLELSTTTYEHRIMLMSCLLVGVFHVLTFYDSTTEKLQPPRWPADVRARAKSCMQHDFYEK